MLNFNFFTYGSFDIYKGFLRQKDLSLYYKSSIPLRNAGYVNSIYK